MPRAAGRPFRCARCSGPSTEICRRRRQRLRRHRRQRLLTSGSCRGGDLADCPQHGLQVVPTGEHANVSFRVPGRGVALAYATALGPGRGGLDIAMHANSKVTASPTPRALEKDGHDRDHREQRCQSDARAASRFAAGRTDETAAAVAHRRAAARPATAPATALAQHGAVGGRGGLLVFTTLTHAGPARRARRRAVHGVQAPGRSQERRRGVRARRLDRRRAEEGRAAARPSRTAPTSSSRPSGRRSRTTTCSRELTASGATVRATPLVQQRGFLTNLLISFAPMLLLVGFYVLDVQAPAGRDGRACSAAASRSASTPRRCASPSTTSPASTRSRPRSTRSSTS